MRTRLRQLALIAALISSGSATVDATIYDGEDLSPRQIIMEKRAERIAVRQVGDVVEASLPWVDQPGLKFKYNLGSTTAMERFLDKRKQEALIDNTSFGEGGVKFDIILNEKPSTNTFCYTVEGAENYIFTYQGVLTPEEIARNSQRPENIIGSYAVYHRSLVNNQYKTGKAFHIERPEVWSLSNEAVKQYATLSYADGQLCVTAPQVFLDTADYPVRIDPTLGYTSVGASSYISSNLLEGHILTLLHAADDIQSISGYIHASTTGSVGTTSFAIYNASTTKLAPHTMATSGQTTINSTPQWHTINIDGTYARATGTLWVVVFATSTPTQIRSYYDNVSTSTFTIAEIRSYVHPPPTMLSGQNVSQRSSMYVTYTTSYACNGSSSLCGEKQILTYSRTTDHGYAGPKLTTRSSTSAFVLFAAPGPTNAVGGAYNLETNDAFFSAGPVRVNQSFLVTLEAMASYVLWDTAWTKSSSTRSSKLLMGTLETSGDDMWLSILDPSTQAFARSNNPLVAGSPSITQGANYMALTVAEDFAAYIAYSDVTLSAIGRCPATNSCVLNTDWTNIGSSTVFRTYGDDVPILFPVGGTNNVGLVYWDTSADTLNYNIYSATSSSWWYSATTTLATAIDDNTTYEGQMISIAYASTTGTAYLAVVDDANDYSTADHDIRVWKYASSSGWTALTNATTTASGGLQGVSISVDPCTGQLFVAYIRRTTIGTATTANIYWATSTDNGSTWSTEKGPITTAQNYSDFGGAAASCFQQTVTYKRVSDDSLWVNTFYNPYYVAPPASEVIYQSEFWF